MFILAAALIIAGVALFVAAPLGLRLVQADAKPADELQAERYEHDRALAVQGLRELEFDHEMGKLSDADYESMHSALEERALTAMAAVEKLRLKSAEAARLKKPPFAPSVQARRPAAPPPRTDGVPMLVARADPQRTLQPQAPESRRARFCAQCGTRIPADSKFCAECGVPIKPSGGAAAWTD